MPTMMTDEEPSRCGIVAMPTVVTDHAWRPVRVSAIHSASSTTSTISAGHGSTVSTKIATAISTIIRRLVRILMAVS